MSEQLSSGPESYVAETTMGIGEVVVDSHETIVCRFYTEDDEVVERVVEKYLVEETTSSRFPRGVIIWVQEEVVSGDMVIAAMDKYYARF